MTPARTPLAENVSWERMIRAVEKVRERLMRATGALERAGIAYAVIGGNAVASWVSTVDESAIRNTPNVDLLVRREDAEAVTAALVAEGFVVLARAMGVGAIFLHGSDAKSNDAVYLVYVGSPIAPGGRAPDVTESQPGGGGYRVISLEALVRMKLISFRNVDGVHLRDLIDVGLIDATRPARFIPELGARLQQILDTPNG